MAGRCAAFLAPAHHVAVAEQVGTGRVGRQPVLHDIRRKRREWGLSRRPLATGSFLLVEEDGFAFEIDVRDLEAEQLTAASAGIGGETDDGLDPRQSLGLADVAQKIGNFGQGQKQGVSKFLLCGAGFKGRRRG